MPKRDWSRITHIWERRFKKTEYEIGELPLAEYICGSGVRLIVLYPWPEDLLMPLGEKKPTASRMKAFSDYASELKHVDGWWYLKWERDAVRNFCVEVLLYHEIGHHVDYYNRRWSKANAKSLEEAADQYAYERTSKRSIQYQS